MKKILFVIDGLSKGGAERVTVWLAEEFSKKEDFDVIILADFRLEKEYILPEKVRVEYVEDYLNRKKWKITKIIEKTQYIDKYIQKGRFDVVISLAMPQFNCYITKACILSKTKLILSERNDPVRYPKHKMLRIARIICYMLCNKVVFQTDNAKNYFSKKIIHKGTVIDNPLSNSLPEPYFGKRKKIIVNFCRLTPQKNLCLLIDAFERFLKKYPEYILNIYGEGEEYDMLKTYINKRNLEEKVNLLPFAENIHQIVIDCMMFVSSSNYEGVSNSMLEALAIGLPCVCTDCPPGGARQFISNGVNGLLTKVGDIKELADAMDKIAGSLEIQAEYSHNAVEIRNRLNGSVIYSKWNTLVKELTDNF